MPSLKKRRKAKHILTVAQLNDVAIRAGRNIRHEHPDTPLGWTTEGWVWRLRHMARVCIHENMAREFRAQADLLEK